MVHCLSRLLERFGWKKRLITLVSRQRFLWVSYHVQSSLRHHPRAEALLCVSVVCLLVHVTTLTPVPSMKQK